MSGTLTPTVKQGEFYSETTGEFTLQIEQIPPHLLKKANS